MLEMKGKNKKIKNVLTTLCMFYFVLSAQICSAKNKKGPCSNDYGSPLVIQENGRYTLVGVTGYVLGCRTFHTPRLYYRVTYRKDWILDNTEGTKDSNCDDLPVTSTQPQTSTEKIEGENPSERSENEAVAAIVGGSAVAVIAIIIGGIVVYR